MSSVDIDTNNEAYPLVKELKTTFVTIDSRYLTDYKRIRNHDKRVEKFLVNSHMMDNGLEIEGVVYSDKFKVLKAKIEEDIKP